MVAKFQFTRSKVASTLENDLENFSYHTPLIITIASAIWEDVKTQKGDTLSLLKLNFRVKSNSEVASTEPFKEVSIPYFFNNTEMGGASLLNALIVILGLTDETGALGFQYANGKVSCNVWNNELRTQKLGKKIAEYEPQLAGKELGVVLFKDSYIKNERIRTKPSIFAIFHPQTHLFAEDMLAGHKQPDKAVLDKRVQEVCVQAELHSIAKADECNKKQGIEERKNEALAQSVVSEMASVIAQKEAEWEKLAKQDAEAYEHGQATETDDDEVVGTPANLTELPKPQAQPHLSDTDKLFEPEPEKKAEPVIEVVPAPTPKSENTPAPEVKNTSVDEKQGQDDNTTGTTDTTGDTDGQSTKSGGGVKPTPDNTLNTNENAPKPAETTTPTAVTGADTKGNGNDKGETPKQVEQPTEPAEPVEVKKTDTDEAKPQTKPAEPQDNEKAVNDKDNADNDESENYYEDNGSDNDDNAYAENGNTDQFEFNDGKTDKTVELDDIVEPYTPTATTASSSMGR